MAMPFTLATVEQFEVWAKHDKLKKHRAVVNHAIKSRDCRATYSYKQLQDSWATL